MIRKIRRELELTQSELADMVGTTQPQIKRLELGERKLTKEWAERLAPHLGVSALQLLFPNEEENLPVLVRENHYLSPAKSRHYLSFDHLDVQAAAGSGSFAPDHVVVIGKIQVLESWARKNLGFNLKSIRLITARGDSMFPTFNDEDILFVDESVRDWRGDGVYIIAAPELRAKRIQRLVDGSLRIISDNASLYPPEIIKGEDLNHLTICGRVVAAWTLTKL